MSKQLFYTHNLDHFEIDAFDKLLGVELTKHDFKTQFKSCLLRENFNAFLHTNRSYVLRQALEEVGL